MRLIIEARILRRRQCGGAAKTVGGAPAKPCDDLIPEECSGEAMRITIQAVIEAADGQPPRVIPISVLERAPDHAPASGLGMFLREGSEV